jgi:hypothetical protein
MNRRFSTQLIDLTGGSLVGAALTFWAASASARDPAPSPERAREILENAPVTLVFRRVYDDPPDGRPYEWTYSINSAGTGELTIDYVRGIRESKPPTRQKFEVSAEKMAAVRKALRDEHFFHPREVDGPVALHSGWTSLTVSAGPLTAIKQFDSPNWDYWKGDDLKKAAPAMRIFLAVCDAVDPEGKVFTELGAVKKAVVELKK